MICLLMKCYVLYCNATQQCNHCKRRPYTRVMRRSRRTYTLAMGEWTAGNHDQAGHRSGTQSFGKSGVHACYVHGMHILPLPWRWSGVTCVCPLRLTIFLHIYICMDIQHSLFTK